MIFINQIKKYRTMRRILLTFALVLSAVMLSAQEGRVRVACVGNSITWGHGIKDRDHDTYPAVLGRLLGDGYEVGNFGICGCTMMNKGDQPYMKEQAYRDALAFNPDIVIIKLGTNDSKPQNWKYKDTFMDDMRTLVTSFQNLPTKPKIYICYPIPSTYPRWDINDSVTRHGVIPCIKRVAKKMHLPVIDLYTAFTPYVHLLPDNVHPNEDGAALIAQWLSLRILEDRK